VQPFDVFDHVPLLGKCLTCIKDGASIIKVNRQSFWFIIDENGIMEPR
jgi:hypothetical protein